MFCSQSQTDKKILKFSKFKNQPVPVSYPEGFLYQCFGTHKIIIPGFSVAGYVSSF